jgi:hypothetical protein
MRQGALWPSEDFPLEISRIDRKNLNVIIKY